MWLPWIEFAVVLAVMALLAIPMGQWLARCFTSEHHGWLERLSYRVMGVNPQERMGWQRYGAALVLSNALMMLLGYLLLVMFVLACLMMMTMMMLMRYDGSSFSTVPQKSQMLRFSLILSPLLLCDRFLLGSF